MLIIKNKAKIISLYMIFNSVNDITPIYLKEYHNNKLKKTVVKKLFHKKNNKEFL